MALRCSGLSIRSLYEDLQSCCGQYQVLLVALACCPFVGGQLGQLRPDN